MLNSFFCIITIAIEFNIGEFWKNNLLDSTAADNEIRFLEAIAYGH